MDERSGGGNVERTLQLLWGTEPRAAKGPRRSLSVAVIVERAVEIADSRGLDAVSIRSVASELGVGAMSLYRYVPSKAELLDLMLDRVNRPRFDTLPRDWRQAMEEVGREMWRLHTTHRWLPLVDQARPVLGPNAVRWLDLVIGALASTSLRDQEKVSLVMAIESFVTNLARTANAVATAQERTGLTHEQSWQAQEGVLTKAMESGEYPNMASLDEDSFSGSHEEVLEFGLRAILDGVQALIDSRGPAR